MAWIRDLRIATVIAREEEIEGDLEQV